MDPTPQSKAFNTDDESIVIDISLLWVILKEKYRVIAAVTAIFALLGCLFAFCIFHEKYRSEATLLFNRDENPSVVTSLERVNRFIQGEGTEISPFKNQEQLLKSRLLVNRIFKQLKDEGVRVQVHDPDQFSEQVINSSHVPGTDFIKISALAETPTQAFKIANAYKDQYLAIINEISYQPLLKQERIFLTQTEEAERQLLAINKKVQEYQEKHGIIDIDTQSQSQVNQLISLESSMKETSAALSEKFAAAKQIRRQLRLSHKDTAGVLDAVASGQDSVLTDLQQKLQDAEKDYDMKALTFAPTNPDMRQLAVKIDTLKKQVTDQQILTIGQVVGTKSGMIKDQVRADLVKLMAENETDAMSFGNKLHTLKEQYNSLQRRFQSVPEEQLTYARLTMDMHNRENVLNKLKEKLSEVQIQKAAIQERLLVIDEPNVQSKPLFPSRLHVILLSALIGLAFSAVAVVGYNMVTRRGVRPEFVEKSLGLPILSILPWLPDKQWHDHRSRRILEVTSGNIHPSVSKAYQDLALNLKVHRNVYAKSALTVCSLFNGADHSAILTNLAFCLAQSGERVLLIDANLRKPHLHESFHHGLDYDKGLPELINSISEALFREQTGLSTLSPLVLGAAIPSGLHPQLHYLNAGVALENTFEFLSSKGFGTLIQTARENYEWILLDAPPFLQVPDAAVLLGYTDGLLLLIERDADEAQVQAVKRKTERLNSTIIGAVLRAPQV